MASLKKLLTDSVVYGLSSIVGRFLNYLLVPLYTYHISAASGGYGVVTNIYAYTALLMAILTFGMETTFFYFANKEGSNGKSVFSTALGAVGFVNLLFVVGVLALLGPVSGAMGYGAHPEYIAVMAVVVALDAFQAILFARLRYENKAWKFASLKLTFIVLNIGLNLFVFLVAPKLQHLSFMQWYDEQNNVGYIFYINLICTALVTFGFWRELKEFRLSTFNMNQNGPSFDGPFQCVDKPHSMSLRGKCAHWRGNPFSSKMSIFQGLEMRIATPGSSVTGSR